MPARNAATAAAPHSSRPQSVERARPSATPVATPRRHARTAEGRHSRRLLSGNPESLLFVACSSVQLKPALAHERGTLDSVSEENIVATLPYSSTARNDGPRHFPALAGARFARRVAPSFPLGRGNPDAKPAPAHERGDGKFSDSTMPHLNRRARPYRHSGNRRSPASFS